MTHEMDIWHDSFVKIKEQTKTIEMRLFDEKRSLISTGDTIIFTDTSNKERPIGQNVLIETAFSP